MLCVKAADKVELRLVTLSDRRVYSCFSYCLKMFFFTLNQLLHVSYTSDVAIQMRSSVCHMTNRRIDVICWQGCLSHRLSVTQAEVYMSTLSPKDSPSVYSLCILSLYTLSVYSLCILPLYTLSVYSLCILPLYTPSVYL